MGSKRKGGKDTPSKWYSEKSKRGHIYIHKINFKTKKDGKRQRLQFYNDKGDITLIYTHPI